MCNIFKGIFNHLLTSFLLYKNYDLTACEFMLGENAFSVCIFTHSYLDIYELSVQQILVYIDKVRSKTWM